MLGRSTDVAIVGAYNTKQARRLEDETSVSITLDAVRGALADAGMGLDDVDGLNVTQGVGLPIIDMSWRISPHQFLGGRSAYLGQQRPGLAAVLEAAAAIRAGYCETMVVATGQAGAYTDTTATAPWTRPDNEFIECFGLFTTAEWALLARYHMATYGTLPEHLAEVAAVVRNHGSMNPAAVGHQKGPYTVGDILGSRMIADPFHLLDCALTSEGGAGLVITTAQRARDLDREPVYILGAGYEVRAPMYGRPPVWAELGWIGENAGAKAFGHAGVTHADIDLCEFYVPFSFEVIHQLEAFGFCPQGEGGPFVTGGRIALGGELPVCTDGGALSHSHSGNAQLLQTSVAAVAQLRGETDDRQVPGAELAFVSSDGFTYRGCVILGKAPR